MSLPIFQTDDKNFSMMQTRWSAILNPVIVKPQNQSNILSGVVLINGATVINHLLGRKLQGWKITDQNALASIYRSQPLNDLTLTLTSNAAVTVDIEVF